MSPLLRARSRPGAVAALLVAALVQGALPGPTATADEPAAPVPVTMPDPVLPVELSSSEPRRWQLQVAGTGTPSTTSITVEGDGVRAHPAHQEVDSAGTAYPAVALTADPGLHTVTVLVEREGWSPRRADYTVWVPGGEPVEGGDSLAGRHWAAPRAAYYSDGRYQSQQSAVWFVDDTHAVLGWPREGLPDCPRDCLPYLYDAGTGLVQLGDVAIGRLTERGVFLDGVLPPGDDWEDGDAWFDQPLGFWAPGRHVSGRWRWNDGDELPSETGPLSLRLRRDGRFLVREAGHGHSGRYVLRPDGLLRLRGDRGWSRRVTLARCLGEHGRPRPGQCAALSWPTLDAGGGVLLGGRAAP